MGKAAQTRQYIIEKTAPLFNTRGFEATSLADLTKATGLTKGAIYGNFVDKDEIAREAFRYSAKKVKALVQNRLSRKITNKDKLIALLDFFGAYVFNPPVEGGCPLLNAAIEADDYRTTERKIVASEILDTVLFIEKLLKQGVKAGEFRRDINTRQLAYSFFCSVEGALMFSRVEQSDEPMKIIVRHCKKVLNDISIK